MPELPEVETIKRQLADKVIGLEIKDIEVRNLRSFLGNPKQIIGSKIVDVDRRAKMIVIGLTCRGICLDRHESRRVTSESSLYLLVHLKMTGQLIYADKKGQFGGGHPVPPFNLDVPNKYTYVIFEFSDGSHLYYNDIRKFGWIKLVLSNKALEQELEKFGPEPLEKEFTAKLLKENLLKHKNLKIKPVLMDQSVVAGLGNIYAAEACFRARIRPDRKISTLSDRDFQNLYLAIKEVLPLAIKYKGTSADAYVTLSGKKGQYFDKLWVYGRDGQPCPAGCGGQVAKMKLGGRGTYWCPQCQR